MLRQLSERKVSLVDKVKKNPKTSALIMFAVLAIITIGVLSYYVSKKEQFSAGGYYDAYAPERAEINAELREQPEFLAGDQDVTSVQVDYAAMEMTPKPTPVDNVGHFNPECANDSQQNIVNSHTEGPEMDYSAYLTDQIVGPEEREQHAKWAKDTMPWSGVARSYDTMDEAMESALPFVGLNRPTPVAQVNPLQITEVGTSTLQANRQLTF
jgi:hypothetical protein